MVDAELEAELAELYQAPLAEFTPLRTQLALAAKKRGDAARAKEITAARKPSTAAWVVNRLVHNDPQVRARLSDLGERLRAAHSAMDGHLIRELSGEQRRLVEGLRQAAMRAAGMDSLSGTLRNDVTDTLQAAVADPDVTARIGRLTKAEHWSGFGQVDHSAATLADSVSVEKPPVEARKSPKSTTAAAPSRDIAAEQEQREQARAALKTAQHVKSEADKALGDLHSDLATARLRVDDARERLSKAESAATSAEQAYRDAQQVSRDATDAVKAAKVRLAELPAARR